MGGVWQVLFTFGGGNNFGILCRGSISGPVYAGGAMFSEKSDSMSKLLALITLTFILNACAGGIVEDPRSTLTLREAQDLAREQKSGGYSGRWQTLENNPSCVVWNPGLQVKSLTTWSGACVNGKAQGRGTSMWRYFKDGDWKETEYTGEMKNGK